jgi:hypothetical protein
MQCHFGGAGHVGREFGNDARDAALRGLKCLHGAAQPGAVANGYPRGGAGLGAWCEGEVQGLGVIQQALFKQAFQHGAQACGAGRAAFGQVDLMP